MTIEERLTQLSKRADSEGVDYSDVEVWAPLELLYAIGGKLGMSISEILEPVTFT